MDDSDDSDLENAWNIGCSSIIPEKSRERYENTYKLFKAWCSEKHCQNITEKVLLAYFVRRSDKLKSPGSLWAEYSMLKATIFLNDASDISKFKTLIAFLKRKNTGYRPKKSKVFSKEDMFKFLKEFPDEVYLNMKLGMIFGIAGACRREELYNLKLEDIQDIGSFIIVNIPNTKTNIPRTFTITTQGSETINYLDIYRKYLKLRPENSKSSNFFLAMRNGKVINQVVGKNTIGRWPSKIAKCLNLSDPLSYTGHAFRRSSATFLANKGVDVLGLKRHGGWRSSSVAEGYVEDSLQNKIEFSKKILSENGDKHSTPNTWTAASEKIIAANIPITSSTSTVTEVSNTENIVSEKIIAANIPITLNNCSNCNFSLIFNKSS